MGWWLCYQPIRIQFLKSVSTNMDFNMEISGIFGPREHEMKSYQKLECMHYRSCDLTVMFEQCIQFSKRWNLKVFRGPTH